MNIDSRFDEANRECKKLKDLRLLITEKCDRNCVGCYNKNWDLAALPYVKHFNYDKIMLTGGEPMLFPSYIIFVATHIKYMSLGSTIILYTAKTDDWKGLLAVLHFIDGLTVTLHEQSDVKPFMYFNSLLPYNGWNKSLRLNIFKGVTINTNNTLLKKWGIKNKIEWIENCPLPENEVFQRFLL